MSEHETKRPCKNISTRALSIENTTEMTNCGVSVSFYLDVSFSAVCFHLSLFLSLCSQSMLYIV